MYNKVFYDYKMCMNYEQFTPTRKDPKTGEEQKKSIYLINMTREIDYHFSEMLKVGINKYINQGKKIAILVNKKGYSNGILCRKCGHVPQCKRCSVSISYHKIWTTQNKQEKTWICHICKSQYNLPSKCDSCWSDEIKEFWLWTQKTAEIIQESFGVKCGIIEQNSANSVNKIDRLLKQIQNHQIIIWTSLLTTPIKWIQFDLFVFLNADQGLNIPDFAANEHNFWNLYDAFTKHKTTNFLVQTFNPDHRGIRAACKLDKAWFFEQEHKYRKENSYPPFGELAMILYKNKNEKSLFNQVDKLYKELLFFQQKYQLTNDIEIFSTPPLVYKVFGKYRYNIILKWTNVRNFMDIVYTQLELAKRGFKVDWDVVSIV